jgi:hypothetical protein
LCDKVSQLEAAKGELELKVAQASGRASTPPLATPCGIFIGCVFILPFVELMPCRIALAAL